jgi:hypothetical protein
MYLSEIYRGSVTSGIRTTDPTLKKIPSDNLAGKYRSIIFTRHGNATTMEE